jgi:hypothetical protein
VRLSRSIAVLLCSLATLAVCVATADAETRRAVPRPAARRVATRPTRAGYFRGYGYRAYYYYGFYGPSPYYGARYDQSSVRLDVKPEETEVYVDSYDGFFPRLRLPDGAHEIELYLDGYANTRKTLYLVAGETYRIRHEMEPLTEGSPQPARPEPPSDPEVRLDPVDPELPSILPTLAAEQFGTLAVRVQPADAEVLVDGERWEGFEGLDRLVIDLWAGPYVVELRRDGYLTYRAEIDLPRGETTLLNVSLPFRETGDPR